MPTVKLGTKAVGSTIKLNLNGSPREFLIMHQGNPSTSMYDASCNGTWVRMKEAYENRQWDSSNNDYANSDVDAWLNGAFLNMLDQDIREQGVKQVKIPYRPGSEKSDTVNTGADGLTCKAFLLSMPTGKQNTFANRTVPDLAYITLRRDQPVNLAGAFECPVRAHGEGYVSSSIQALSRYAMRTYQSFTEAPEQAFCVGAAEEADSLAPSVKMQDMLDAVGSAVSDYCQTEAET